MADHRDIATAAHLARALGLTVIGTKGGGKRPMLVLRDAAGGERRISVPSGFAHTQRRTQMMRYRLRHLFDSQRHEEGAANES